MHSNIKKINGSIFLLLTFLFVQAAAQAQPLMVPGFMAIENSSMDAPAAGSDSSNAYFTISNLHYEPIILLSASGDTFETATFIGSNGNELDQVVIQPGGRLTMGPNNVHLRISGIDAEATDEGSQDITLLIRRGLEPEEAVEAIEELGAMSGVRSREAGIPNEKKYVVHVMVRD